MPTLTHRVLILFAPNLALLPSSGHLVNIPLGGLAGFISELPKPDWSAVLNPTTMQVALTLALIASIESLLCVEATDRLDPDKNSSDTNRELVAQGIGNALCGALGALPITSVIVRSSANIYSGSKSRLSSFVHGVFLVVAVAALAQFLNQIPIAALAIVLQGLH